MGALDLSCWTGRERGLRLGLVGAVFFMLVGAEAQNPWHQDQGLKALVHAQAQQKQRKTLGGPVATSSDPMLADDKCCTVAMFLASIPLSSGSDAMRVGDQALDCCRRILCPRFKTQSDCLWISSGDTSWKDKLSQDLDRVQTVENRIDQIKGDDLDDPSAQNELGILRDERNKIESRELQRLAKVAPLTAMCDEVLDSDAPAQGGVDDLEEEQEARIQCIVCPLH
mmetsp:Transcript_35835/g.55901  ORF Transcript_35835/g.55901 Transcript_35835/m.55901 type:complete len:226 (+) Transcript_35835:63-740(+)